MILVLVELVVGFVAHPRIGLDEATMATDSDRGVKTVPVLAGEWLEIGPRANAAGNQLESVDTLLNLPFNLVFHLDLERTHVQERDAIVLISFVEHALDLSQGIAWTGPPIHEKMGGQTDD
jgi:hypothetical protein